MEVNSTNNNTVFKSGLTRKIVKDILSTDVAKAEADFAKIGTEADFKGKKSICANFVYATNILYDISEKFKLPFDFTPYTIKVYNDKEIIDSTHKYFAFAINDSGKVLKNQDNFIGGSIFVNDKNNGILANNYYTTKHYLLGRRSSPHFLANALHEWFHTIHMDLMYKKYGYGGKCPILKEQYNKAGLNKGLKKYESLGHRDMSFIPEDFQKLIGKYAIKSGSMLELFAELMTKITAEALDKDLKVIKNPLDNLPKDMPKEIKFELERIMDI